MIRPAINFICVMSVFSVIAWVGGYDFDRRDPVVAICLAVAITVSVCYVGLLEGNRHD